MTTTTTTTDWRGDAPRHTAATPPPRVLIWDAPTRVFHWLMVLSFVGAYVTGESERLRLLHVTLGYTMAGLLAFRLLWGFVGTRHARFADFVRGPRAAWRYVTSLLRGRPEHHVGHNPAGALAIVGLLVLTALTALTGWASYEEIGGEWLEELHEGAANTMLALVLVHVTGVVVGSLVHRENLVGSMITGRKPAPPQEAIAHAWRSVAALMLGAVLAFWWLQWASAPPPLRDGRAGVVQQADPRQAESRKTDPRKADRRGRHREDD